MPRIVNSHSQNCISSESYWMLHLQCKDHTETQADVPQGPRSLECDWGQIPWPREQTPATISHSTVHLSLAFTMSHPLRGLECSSKCGPCISSAWNSWKCRSSGPAQTSWTRHSGLGAKGQAVQVILMWDLCWEMLIYYFKEYVKKKNTQ